MCAHTQGAHEMILEMVAWRDPNVVPVKAFYGDDLKVGPRCVCWGRVCIGRVVCACVHVCVCACVRVCVCVCVCVL